MQNSDNMANSLPDLRGSMGEHLGIKFITMAFGLLNGGASLALAEMVAGHGSVPLCSTGEMPCGIQVSANHVGMVRVEEGAFVTATGTIVHRGRTTHIWNIDITSQTGKLISTARVVNQIVKKRI